jgi:hypothetical protein
MRITNAQIALDSERSALQLHRTEETLQASSTRAGRSLELGWSRSTETLSAEFQSYQQLARVQRQAPSSATTAAPGVTGAANATAAFRPPGPVSLTQPRVPGTPDAPRMSAEDLELAYFKLLIELFSDREVRFARISVDASGAATADSVQQLQPAQGQPPAQFSIDYSFSEYYRESESTQFMASGTVQTADGRELAFSFSLSMERSFESTTVMRLQSGTPKDPLVLNFSGSGPQLSSMRYSFDLDADGTAERVVMATGSSAFLALDRDGNGRIDDGSELFGALSGDGFAELARHDEDGNGFIDAGDSVFSRLLAYRKDASGADQLQPLAALGVGALYLGSVASAFSIRTADNQSVAEVRRSGVYLDAGFGVGSMQQLDLMA